jgi:cell volume regulation protein A
MYVGCGANGEIHWFSLGTIHYNMVNTIIISVCLLVLIGYAFDLTSSKSRIPSVILLLVLGWASKQLLAMTGLSLPDMNAALPVLGTIGLILIVLEGSLELELKKKNMAVIRKSLILASIPMMIMAFYLTWMLIYYQGGSFRNTLLNVVPLCVISSAIAIPTVRNLKKNLRDFVVYESSFSDIIGVLFFNFVMLNDYVTSESIGHFILEIVIMILISFVATAVLALLLRYNKHHIKFIPIIMIVLLIYALAKHFHLPALLFVMILGLFLGNLDELKQFKIIQRLHPEILNKEVHRFQEIVMEGAFIIRVIFFILFGYLIENHEILNAETLLPALVVTAVIFVLRGMQLKLSGIPMLPLIFVAPRGLITILLFLSIDPAMMIPTVNKSLILQVIVFTALMMMIGMILAKSEKDGKKAG